MTGEIRVGWRISESIQPGGRPPAPGALALVQSFINSHYDLEVSHGADLLATPPALGKWLADHNLIETGAPLQQRDVERTVAVREGLRALASRDRDCHGHGHGHGHDKALTDLNVAAVDAPVELRLGTDGPYFMLSSEGGVGAALGLVLALSAQAMIDGTWARLKVCPGDDCGWAFYDQSRNQTGRWCSMSVCGGRAKARAHYRRRQDGSS